jgi:nicotinamide-nucleotide amidase
MPDDTVEPGRARRDGLAAQIAELACERHHRIAVAESLTGGMLSNDLARAEGSGDWFLGGIVSYGSQFKRDVLSVRPGPVVSEAAARDMANGVIDLCGAMTSVAVTGVGGPEEQDGKPPGTVWLAVHHGGETTATLLHMDGDAEEICAATCEAALSALLDRLRA